MSEAAALDALRGAGFAGSYACALVTGTGLGGIAEGLEEAVSIPYAAVPGFPGRGSAAMPGGCIAGPWQDVRFWSSRGGRMPTSGAMRP